MAPVLNPSCQRIRKLPDAVAPASRPWIRTDREGPSQVEPWWYGGDGPHLVHRGGRRHPLEMAEPKVIGVAATESNAGTGQVGENG